ncbi:hypothetical protein AURDEDRAFT_171357 [Auricularia subglabra TFB-10046 SS5]|uniref:Protein kinase domain-containing protein n=1 Tax=Auricularia subglabra (strain TFB-10046 / SS5) TaxID=717982 RepID=J0DC17_AURST|nr:hypothetical protein AURDEDRAFT_171357 [Auricularia subglabra TFB-10046 SS5]
MAPRETSPFRHNSGGPAEARKQSDLKPLMELEVCGVVFESDDVPNLFFPEEECPIALPDLESDELQTLMDDLRHIHKEDQAYKPLVAVFSYIVNRSDTSSASLSYDDASGDDDSSRSLPSVFFIVYTKQMKDIIDGAGRLKPDVLGTDKKVARNTPVPWIAVRIAIEVKEHWRDGLQQALTYARSMLAIGDKWFSMVIVYNHKSRELRFCFATRHAIFVTPKWSFANVAQRTKIASTLVRACKATGSMGGFDVHRSLDAEGKLHLHLPGIRPTLKQHEYLCRKRHIIGRATHVYTASFTEPPEPVERNAATDPPGFAEQLETDSLIHVPLLEIAGQAHPERAVNASRSTHHLTVDPASLETGAARLPVEPVSAQSLPAHGLFDVDSPVAIPADSSIGAVLPQAHEAAAASKMYARGSWESLCREPQMNWAPALLDTLGAGKLVVKDAWVAYERLNTEVDVLQAVKGLYGFVEYAGHMIVPHPGMERLSQVIRPPTGRKKKGGTSHKCIDWAQVYPQGEPMLIKRVHRLIFYKTLGYNLIAIGRLPRIVAEAMKDAAAALLLLHSKDYIHRDLSTWNLMARDKPFRTTPEQLATLKQLFGDKLFSKIANLFVLQYAFLIDFDHSVKWNAHRDPLPSRSGTWAFMAAARIRAWISKARWVDTLIDDLESAIWSLFYAVLKANFARLSEMEKLHYDSFNSDAPYTLASTKHMIIAFEKDEMGDLSALKETWPLWWRLFRVARGARLAITTLKGRLPPGKTFADAGEDIKVELDMLYKSTVYDYVEAATTLLLSKPYFNSTHMSTSSGSNQQPEGHAGHQDSLKDQLELELREAMSGGFDAALRPFRVWRA